MVWKAYCTTIEHAAGDVLLWWELVAFALQTAVDLAHVAQIVAPISSSGPRLYQLEHLVLDVVVGCDVRGCAEEGCEVVEKLARSDFLYEVRAAILDACVCELKLVSAWTYVGV